MFLDEVMRVVSSIEKLPIQGWSSTHTRHTRDSYSGAYLDISS